MADPTTSPAPSTLSTLIELMLPRCGAVILRNPHGVIELRGADLYLRRGKTLTLYHRDTERGEARSHAHFYLSGLRWARVVERPGVTPFLGFWPDRSEVPGPRAPLTIYFPRFYDWDAERTPNEENQAYFRGWVTQHGRCFALSPDTPVDRSARADAGFPGSHQVGGGE